MKLFVSFFWGGVSQSSFSVKEILFNISAIQQNQRDGSMRRTEPEVADFEAGGRGHKPRSMDSLSDVEMAIARKSGLSWSLQKEHSPADTMILSQGGCVRLLTFRTVIYKSCVFFGLFYFFLFRATPKAHGHSQARGQIRAAAEAYATTTATPDPSCIFDLHCSSRQCSILNPSHKARNQICS